MNLDIVDILEQVKTCPLIERSLDTRQVLRRAADPRVLNREILVTVAEKQRGGNEVLGFREVDTENTGHAGEVRQLARCDLEVVVIGELVIWVARREIHAFRHEVGVACWVIEKVLILLLDLAHQNRQIWQARVRLDPVALV